MEVQRDCVSKCDIVCKMPSKIDRLIEGGVKSLADRSNDMVQSVPSYQTCYASEKSMDRIDRLEGMVKSLEDTVKSLVTTAATQASIIDSLINMIHTKNAFVSCTMCDRVTGSSQSGTKHSEDSTVPTPESRVTRPVSPVGTSASSVPTSLADLMAHPPSHLASKNEKHSDESFPDRVDIAEVE